MEYKNPYIDATWTGAESEIACGMVHPQAVYFEDVYPHSDLQVYTITHDQRKKVDSNTGAKTDEIYYVWFIQLKDPNESGSNLFTWDEKTLASCADNPKIVFKTGLLAGYEFEFIYHDAEGDSDSNYNSIHYNANTFELIFQEDNGVVVPGMTSLLPTVGDEVTLINIEMPDEYIKSAKTELITEAKKYIEELAINHNTYTVDLYPTLDGTDLSLTQIVNVGARVSLGYYDSSDSQQSFVEDARVSKVEWCLDFPTQKQVTISNSEIVGTTSALEASIQASIQENEAVAQDLNAAYNSFISSLETLYNTTEKKMSELTGFWDLQTVSSGSTETTVLHTPYSIGSGGTITAFCNSSQMDTWFSTSDFYWNNGKLAIKWSNYNSLATLSTEKIDALEQRIKELEEKLNAQ